MGAKTTREIAEWVCKTNFDSFGFSPAEIKYINGLALSHIGMTLAGSTMRFGKIVNNYVKELGSRAEAGVIGGGFRCNAEDAALANGGISHTTELEDNSFPEGIYGCGAWPTAFALAEKHNLSGKDMFEAFVIGWEVAGQLGAVAMAGPCNKRGWGLFATLLNIGCAAMAAKMLKLNVEQTASALSLGASQAQGLARQTGTGAHLIEAGFDGRNGICAAKLAKAGYTGNPTILEGMGGFVELHTNNPDFDLPLGEGWRVHEVAMKKYPCCWYNHQGIDTVLDLIAEHNISWDDVESVNHSVNKTTAYYLKFADPKTADESRFSLQHATVCCFFDDKVFLDSFSDEEAQDPRYVEARKKVTLTFDPQHTEGMFTEYNSPVTIKLKNGKVYTKTNDGIRGDANHKLSESAVMEKFTDCVNYSKLLTGAQAQQVAEMVWKLDQLKDISGLMEILTFPKGR